MLNQWIAVLRHCEYIERVSRLPFTTPQRLTLNPLKGTEPLHIVYVMNHVGMCGGTKVIFEHANRLILLGAKVSIVAHFPKPDWYPLQADYIVAPFQMELTRLIPACQVIVATYWEQIQACVETGIAPVVYFEQGDFHLYDWEQDTIPQEVKNVVRQQYQLAPYVATVSQTVAALIENKFDRKAAVFPNALDAKVFYPRTQQPAKRYMLIVGREQTKFKGIQDLQQVFKLLRDRGYDIELRWITQQRPVNEMGQVFCDPPSAVIGDLYRQAFVYVCGSYYEAFPLPPLEAMACGAPVVTTGNVGVREYARDGYNCLMGPPGDVEGLAAQIIRLFNDDVLYRQLQQNGYVTAGQFQWEPITRRLLAYYCDIAQYIPADRWVKQDWEMYCREEDFLDPNAPEMVSKFLAQTAADIVLVPAVHDFLPGRKLVSWQVAAKRKLSGSGYIDKVSFAIHASNGEWRSQAIASLYAQGHFAAALHQAEERLAQLKPDQVEWAVAVRWLAMCLMELERYDEAIVWLEQAAQFHPLYTDLSYVRGVIAYYQGDAGQANSFLKACVILQDAVYYPEYFADMRQIAASYIGGEKHD